MIFYQKHAWSELEARWSRPNLKCKRLWACQPRIKIMDMRELYEEMLLDHNRNPRNFGELSNPTHQGHGFNPICQDEFSVYLFIDDDNIIKEVKFDGAGCAVSTASISLMTQAIKGKPLPLALDIFERMRKLLTGVDDGQPPIELGKLKILEGVHAFPTRIKCATLGWHIFKAAVDGEDSPVNTEGEHFCATGGAH
jgi:nitrogen fixation protein NifU and related proteins